MSLRGNEDWLRQPDDGKLTLYMTKKISNNENIYRRMI